MLTAHQNGDVLITAGTGKMSPKLEEEIGLAGEHDYAILRLTESRGRKKLLVKNPWLSGPTWKGGTTIDDEDDVFTQNENVTPHEDSKLDRRFWMTMNELAQNFNTLYLNWNPVLFTHRKDIHFTWNLRAESRSGRVPSVPSILTHNMLSVVKKEAKS